MKREIDCTGIDAELTAYSQGELAEGAREEIELHLQDCAGCRDALAEIRGVFSMAAEVEDLAPSPRFKRAVSSLLARELSPDALPETLGFRIRSAFAFLVHRARVSPRFRLAAISVGAHAVLLLLVSFVVLPRIANPVTPVVQIQPDGTFETVKGPVPPEIAFGPDETEMELPLAQPLPDEHLVHGAPTARFPNTLPLQPPARPARYQPFSGLFSSALLTSGVKERRLASVSPGADRTMAAIGNSLDYLAGAQEADGSWPASERSPTYRTGVSATALLAFLSDGHSQTRGDAKWQAVVRKGIGRLMADQVRTGKLKGLLSPAEGHYNYNHALATLALVESWVIDRRRLPATRARQLRVAIGDAVAFIVKTQSTEGAWRYQFPVEGSSESDTSVSIFEVMALASARQSGFEVPGPALDGFTNWLKKVTGKNGVVGYQRRGDRDADPRTLTAGALFLEEFLGLAAPLRDRQARLVLADLEDPEGPAAHDGLLRFFSAHAFRLRGQNVLTLTAPGILDTQRPDGSWGAAESEDRHAVHAGDVFMTALNSLTLSSAYRWAI